MAEWVYFLHPPRDDFAATMTDEERDAWREHAVRLEQLLDEGTLVLAGPTLGRVNTGIAVIRGARRAVGEGADGGRSRHRGRVLPR